ncbi:PadR family transcriptional regulator [Streptosporangium violaceochromogenes]|nr:PadR family transcriptional regulator [Streptosporangium violaceochromogenes]
MSLRHALLGLLGEEPASGYDLLKTFEDSLANVWPATQSQVYGELARLAEAGLVEVGAEGPRGRKEYSITPAGREEMRHWLTRVKPAPLAKRSEILLRVFFLGQVAPAEARAYLRGQAETAERRTRELATMKESVERKEGDLPAHGLMALEWGLRFNAMHAEWARWAESRIREETRGRPPEAARRIVPGG